MLSDSRADVPGNHAGHLSADFADERPGGRADSGRHSSGISELLPDGRTVGSGDEKPAGGAVQNRLCSAGTAADAGLSGGLPASAHLPAGGGRSALHFSVGTGFPAGLSADPRFFDGASLPASGGCLYGDGDAAGFSGYHRKADTAGSLSRSDRI